MIELLEILALLLLPAFLLLDIAYGYRRARRARGWRLRGYNYADLPLWDMVFGTFRNPPAGYDAEAGLGHGASARLGALLLGRNVKRA